MNHVLFKIDPTTSFSLLHFLVSIYAWIFVVVVFSFIILPKNVNEQNLIEI